MIRYRTVDIDDLRVFYREAGDPTQPDFLLLHGFPSSSAQFRNLMPLLEKDFHLIAPDYIGFGCSQAPSTHDFHYTFDHLTQIVEKLIDRLDLKKFYLYVFDYGAPIGFRIALHQPERIAGIVSQNGNIYQEGLGPKWADRVRYWKNPTPEQRQKFEAAFDPQTIRGQYVTGEAADTVPPDGYRLDIAATHDPGYADRQDALILDYRNNVKLYPRFQQYVRTYQPQILAIWGKNDPSFIYPGALAFLKDAPHTEVHLLDGGHFVLETHYRVIADLIEDKWA